MIIYTTTSGNLLALPLLIAIWAIDIYLLMIGVRLLAEQLSGTSAAHLCQGLQPITDKIPMAIRRWLVARSQGRPTASWAPWAITIGGGLVLRHILIFFVVGTAC